MKNSIVSGRVFVVCVLALFMGLSAGCAEEMAIEGTEYGADSNFNGSPPDQEPSVDPSPDSNPSAEPPPPNTPPSNPFEDASEDNLATFSIDVDTASYTSARRTLNANMLPNPMGVRTEEYINFFRYDYDAPSPTDREPFSIHLEAAPSAFGEEGMQLLRVGIQGMEIPAEDRAPTNLVFLVDVSGSMNNPNKLGLVRYSLQTLTNALRPEDTLSIVTYAGSNRIVLEPTPVGDRAAVLSAIEQMQAGGGTNGAAGINSAYELAQSAFIEGGINRVVLCTDGDFNVGLTGEPLIELVEEWRDLDITLSVLAFGGGFNDSFLESLTNRGNGNYAFIDTQNEALRVLGENLVGTLQVIAKDVKIQVELNAEAVARYRVIGYENRALRDDDFDDDSVDAGEIGSGHAVTAYLELEMLEGVDPGIEAGQLAQVHVRYKKPDEDVSALVTRELMVSEMRTDLDEASDGFRFGAAVSEFAEILRHSEHSEGDDFNAVRELADEAAGQFASSDQRELLDLIEVAGDLWP